MSPPPVSIRRATPHDAGTVARHRARMFQDMGELSAAGAELLREKAEPMLERALADGSYLGWLACDPDQPDHIIAGAGVQLQKIFPRPLGQSDVGEGFAAVIVNVFTEPEWRRRGIAERLLREILEWSRGQRLDRLTLHASADGRALYEKLGFVQNNEMKLRKTAD